MVTKKWLFKVGGGKDGGREQGWEGGGGEGEEEAGEDVEDEENDPERTGTKASKKPRLPADPQEGDKHRGRSPTTVGNARSSQSRRVSPNHAASKCAHLLAMTR